MKTATFDAEFNSLNPDTIWCAVVKDHGTRETKSFIPDTVHTLPSYLDTFDRIIGHNCIDFDLPALRRILDWEYRGQVVDTLIMSRVQRPLRALPPGCTGTGPHSVAAWGWRLGHRKLEHEEWHTYSPEMLERCKTDVEIQYQIYHALLEEGKGEGWEHAHRLNMKLLQHLQRQGETGWYVDQEHLDRCLHMLDHWIKRIDKTISPKLPLISEPKETKKDGDYGYIKKPFKKDGSYAASTLHWFPSCMGERSVAGPYSRVSFRPVDLDKNVEVKDYLLSLGWQPEEWNTNNAGQRTSPKLSHNDAFIGIQGALGRLVARRVQCKQRAGVLKGWKALIREDGRISTKVVEFASTGRIRHSVVVNVPSSESGAFFGKWMRKIFRAQPGWVMVGCDSKGNQIRQLAARMGDEEFTTAVLFGKKEDNTDLHSINQRKAQTSTRTTAKNFFYGLIFGASNKKLRQYGNASREDFLNQMPHFKELLEKLSEEWRETAEKVWIAKWGKYTYRNGYIKGIDGRPILVDSEHKILNYLLQSDEAIQMACAYCWVHSQMKKLGYKLGRDWNSLIWYHDEIVAECKPDVVEDLEYIMKESIAWAGRYLKIQCPHEGESKIGMNWSETH